MASINSTSNTLTDLGQVIQAHISSKIAFLVALNFFLLIAGSLMEIYGALVVIVPLIVPIAKEYGINPVHLGIIFLIGVGAVAFIALWWLVERTRIGSIVRAGHGQQGNDEGSRY
jgi:TRAP-type C4-dicarboxylate transport system permease large subunit